MYAIVEIKNKQYKIEKDSLITVDKITQEENTSFDDINVLFYKSDDNSYKVGKPYVKNIQVQAKVQNETNDKKINVYKYKKRKGYRRTKGHRQKYTNLLIEDIKAA